MVVTGISKATVIQRLWVEVEKESNSGAVKVRALEVILKDYWLLERQEGFDFPESPDQCTDAQLMQIQRFFLKWICGKDAEKMRELERRLSIEAGLVIDVPRQEPMSEF